MRYIPSSSNECRSGSISDWMAFIPDPENPYLNCDTIKQLPKQLFDMASSQFGHGIIQWSAPF